MGWAAHKALPRCYPTGGITEGKVPRQSDAWGYGPHWRLPRHSAFFRADPHPDQLGSRGGGETKNSNNNNENKNKKNSKSNP